MKNLDTNAYKSLGTPPRWLMIVLLLSGLLLLFLSILLEQYLAGTLNTDWLHLLEEFLRELGIVVFTVSSVSLLYELFVAEKYMSLFLQQLRIQVEQGESNAAVCALLGINRIFPTRRQYETAYPLDDLMAAFAPGSSLRIVARSLFLLMGQPVAIRKAVEQGGSIELCLFNPQDSRMSNMPDLERTDIQAAISRFEKELVTWVKSNLPPGSIELHTHSVSLFDSYTSLRSSSDHFVVWDLSFGRDVGQKRILMLDPEKPLARDIGKRYNHVWENSRTIFKYDGKTKIVKTNRLRLLLGPRLTRASSGRASRGQLRPRSRTLADARRR